MLKIVHEITTNVDTSKNENAALDGSTVGGNNAVTTVVDVLAGAGHATNPVTVSDDITVADIGKDKDLASVRAKIQQIAPYQVKAEIQKDKVTVGSSSQTTSASSEIDYS